MASINTFTIVGNVTKDVELRYTPSGTPSVTFTVAVDNVYFDRDGKKHEETDFIPVTTYGKQAENDAKFLKKGSTVAVMGRIRSWYKQAERKGGFNFEAERVQYLGRPSGNRAGGDAGQQQGPGQIEGAIARARNKAADTSLQLVVPVRQAQAADQQIQAGYLIHGVLSPDGHRRWH